MIKQIAISLSFLSVLIAYKLYDLGLGYKKEEFSKYYGNCEYIQTDLNLIGSEDAVFYDEDTLIGCHSNLFKIYFAGVPLEQVERGGCYSVKGIASGKLQVDRLELNQYPSGLDFFPHGQYIRGNNFYVSNHAYKKGKGERIEVFKIKKSQDGKLSISYDHYTQLGQRFTGVANDLVVLNDNRFLVTDWVPVAFPLEGPTHASLKNKIIQNAYQMLKIKGSNLWDCQFKVNDLSTCQIVEGSEGVMVNGVAFDQKDTILISDTFSRELRSFKLQKNGSLQLSQILKTRLAADNINFDQVRNQFLVGGTLSFLDLKNLLPAYEQVQKNPGNQSLITYWGGVDAVRFDAKTNELLVSELFTAEKASAVLAGGLISASGETLFLTTFSDKSISACKKQN
ncbi:hypothetical protein ABPG72_014307 [Tetrahymena utriculariae]